MATLAGILEDVSIGKKNPDTSPPNNGTMVWLKECAYQRVVVYQDRAEVIREVEMAVKEGENEVTLVGLPQVADKDFIRVEVESTEVYITDVVYVDQLEVETAVREERNGEEKPGTGEGEDLRAAVRGLKREKALVDKRIEVVRRTRTLLEKFGSMLEKGRTSERKKEGDQVLPNFNELTNGERLKTVVGFSEAYLRKLSSYSTQITELQEQSSALKEKLTVMEMNLKKRGEAAAAATANSTTSFQKAVKISLESKSTASPASPRSVKLFVSYLVSNASWEPLYHLRVSVPETKDAKQKPLLQIHYFGLIKQSSGEDWNSTKISLSTATPSKGGSPPTLQPNNLRVYQQPILRGAVMMQKQAFIPTIGFSPKYKESYGSAMLEGLGESLGANYAPQMQEVEEQKVSLHSTQFVQRFDTARPATIPSDGTEHKVAVTVIDLEPVLEHVSVPEKSNHCFITARVNNESAYPLLAGSSSVFLNNNFIAKSKVGNVAPSEELVVSLGADPEVRVKYKPGEAVTNLQEGWISTSKQLAYNTLTTIKNTKRDPISLILRLSLPVSREKKVAVNLKEPPCHQVDKPVRVEGGTAQITSKNHVEWKIGINPGVSHRVLMLYDVNT